MKPIVNFVVAMLFYFFTSLSFAQQNNGMQVIHSQIPGLVKQLSLKSVRPMDTTAHMILVICLPLRNQQAQATLLHDLYDPASPRYHQWLSHPQVILEFSPTETDYQAVISFAKANGLSVTHTVSDRMLIDVSGSVGDIQRALNVNILMYNHPTENREFYAPDAEPSINLSVPVLGIRGLDNYQIPRPTGLKTSSAQPGATGSGPGGTYIGNDFRAAYAPGVSLNGHGQKVGIFVWGSGFYQSDITAYENLAGISPYVPVASVFSDTATGTPDPSTTPEVSVDIEMAISMAPGLDSVLVFDGWWPEHILDSMETCISVKQFSSSWGAWEDYTVDPPYFKNFALQGQSFFNGSGDDGAWTYPYAPPYKGANTQRDTFVTIVGGTVLTTTGPGGAWSSETGWFASGGGILDRHTDTPSVAIPIPSYQIGVANSGNGASSANRNGPDVAINATNVYRIYNNGSDSACQGTSVSSPLWAGFMALVNQQAMSLGGEPFGCINYAIYPLGEGNGYDTAFHDITSGSNNKYGFGYNAVSGYDLVTGWGTPHGQALINDLTICTLANYNISTNYWPTGYNNEQPLVRSADGKVHEVFSSGGEIFYRRSSNNGSSWDITTMLSNGYNGTNDCPSIAACYYSGSTSQLEVVWQQQLTSTTYAIWYAYSANDGVMWSTPGTIHGCSNVTVSSVQSNGGYGQGATPVVSNYLVMEQGAPSSFLVVYSDMHGLEYTTSKSGQSNWLSSGPISVPGTYNQYGASTIWHPSLASYITNTTVSTVYLVYADKYNGYYSQRYSSVPFSEHWDSGPVLIHANTYCMSPSLSVDITSGTYAAWSEYEGSLGKYTVWQWSGNPSGTWPSTWYSEFTTLPENAFYPTNTYYYYSGQQYPNRIDILAWGNANNDIWQLKFDGNGGWTEQTLSLGYTAAAPNLTHEVQGTGTPLQLWTNESQSPYLIEDGSNNLPKVAPTQVAMQTSRAAEMFDKIDHSVLRVDMTEPLVTTASGSTIPVPFKQYDYSQGVSVSSSSIFDYLRTDSVQIPSDAASMSFNLTVTIDLPDTLDEGTINKDTTSVFNGATVGLNIMGLSSGRPVLNSQPITSSIASRHTKLSKAMTVPLQSLQGRTIAFQLFGTLKGIFNESDLAMSLINVHGSTTSSAGATAQSISSAILPSGVSLGQNYPNPFNPTTSIVYRVTQAGRVSLKIYDVLGREVATLVNGDQAQGVYAERFDASHLSSGIYFYQLIAPGVSETRKMLVTK